MSAPQHDGKGRDGAAAGTGSSGISGGVAPAMRGVLPIPDPQHVGLTTYAASDPNTKYPPITMLRPPPGAPNVLIVLIDDVGFAASSAFGILRMRSRMSSKGRAAGMRRPRAFEQRRPYREKLRPGKRASKSP